MNGVYLVVQNRRSRFPYRSWPHIGYLRLRHFGTCSRNYNDANNTWAYGLLLYTALFLGQYTPLSVIWLTLKM